MLFSDKENFKEVFLEKLQAMHGKDVEYATATDIYKTLGSIIREDISKNWIATNRLYKEKEVRQVYYFSMEFLLGRLMMSNILNLNIMEIVAESMKELGYDLKEIEEQEPDAGLGNGGLGRLAACFVDSLASLGLPGHGCSIRYKYGLFEQKLYDGYQMELPEYWLKEGNVWEVRRLDKAVGVKFGGNVKVEKIKNKLHIIHENYETVLAVPYDTPIVGYGNDTVNTLRLWNAESAIKELDFRSMNIENYHRVVDYKHSTESISEFLYPDDTNREGRELRLKQQYFLVSAGVQSITNGFKFKGGKINDLHNKIAIHVNDTHPVLAIPELMRILMDENGLGWEEAWHITTNTISYTNHTTLSEALEKWPVDIFKPLLPRIYMIVAEINERFCKQLWEVYPGDWDRIHQMAIVADGQVKMAHMAIAGSYSVNGVAELHTDILKKKEMKIFYDYYPYKFNNKTNGITHRRWLLKANPKLADLITEAIGEAWISKPEQLSQLTKYIDDSSFKEKLGKIKQANKNKMVTLIEEKFGTIVSPDSIFDVQIKRIHAYKRQILKIFYIMDLYNNIKENPSIDIYPRTFIFGGKAAPSYHLAKRVIKLITTVAEVVNNDKDVNGKIKVVFLENYRVSLAEDIIPATDVSEQISTASKEASGTGNMKFMMNGAATIGTLDGANIEIKREAGDDNIFTFGLTSSEVLNYYHHGGYSAWEIYENDSRIKRVLGQLIDGSLPARKDEFSTIYYSLLNNNDEYFILKDFSSYVEAQSKVDEAYRDQNRWLNISLHNIANSGWFSSDRTISEYAKNIWEIEKVNLK